MAFRRFRKTMVKKQSSFASRSSSSRFQASLTRNTGSEVSVDESGDPTFHPRQTPNRDLAGKYGDPAASQVILQGSNSAGSQNPPSGDSTLGTLY